MIKYTHTHSKYIFQVLISHKMKFIYCLISKNGCSSILSSIIYHDFEEYRHHIDTLENRKIWTHLPFRIKNKIQYLLINPTVQECVEQGYKIFMVLRPSEKERLLTTLNHTYNDQWEKMDINDLTSQIFADYEQMIDINDNNKSEAHFIPQIIYYQKFCDTFGKENIEIVDIKDLQTYFENTFNKKFIINNVNKTKCIFEENLNEKNKELLNYYANKYELIL